MWRPHQCKSDIIMVRYTPTQTKLDPTAPPIGWIRIDANTYGWARFLLVKETLCSLDHRGVRTHKRNGVLHDLSAKKHKTSGRAHTYAPDQPTHLHTHWRDHVCAFENTSTSCTCRVHLSSKSSVFFLSPYLGRTLVPTTGSGLWSNVLLSWRRAPLSAKPCTAERHVASCPHVPCGHGVLWDKRVNQTWLCNHIWHWKQMLEANAISFLDD